MLRGAAQTVRLALWLGVFPGLAIGIVVFAWNLLGDALQDFWIPGYAGPAKIRSYPPCSSNEKGIGSAYVVPEPIPFLTSVRSLVLLPDGGYCCTYLLRASERPAHHLNNIKVESGRLTMRGSSTSPESSCVISTPKEALLTDLSRKERMPKVSRKGSILR